MFVKNFGQGDKWLPGKILSRSGPVSFVVELVDGRRKRCHQDHLRVRGVDGDRSETPQEASEESLPVSLSPTPGIARDAPPPQAVTVSGPGPSQLEQSSVSNTEPTRSAAHPTDSNDTPTDSLTLTPPPVAAAPATPRYPQRDRKRTQRYEPETG